MVLVKNRSVVLMIPAGSRLLEASSTAKVSSLYDLLPLLAVILVFLAVRFRAASSGPVRGACGGDITVECRGRDTETPRRCAIWLTPKSGLARRPLTIPKSSSVSFGGRSLVRPAPRAAARPAWSQGPAEHATRGHWPAGDRAGDHVAGRPIRQSRERYWRARRARYRSARQHCAPGSLCAGLHDALWLIAWVSLLGILLILLLRSPPPNPLIPLPRLAPFSRGAARRIPCPNQRLPIRNGVIHLRLHS